MDLASANRDRPPPPRSVGIRFVPTAAARYPRPRLRWSAHKEFGPWRSMSRGANLSAGDGSDLGGPEASSWPRDETAHEALERLRRSAGPVLGNASQLSGLISLASDVRESRRLSATHFRICKGGPQRAHRRGPPAGDPGAANAGQVSQNGGRIGGSSAARWSGESVS